MTGKNPCKNAVKKNDSNFSVHARGNGTISGDLCHNQIMIHHLSAFREGSMEFT
jgi:hypothetical protein